MGEPNFTIRTKTHENYSGYLAKIDKFQNVHLNYVTVTKLKAIDETTGEPKVYYLDDAYIKGQMINSIILPKDTIERYIDLTKKQNEDEVSQEDLEQIKKIEQQEEQNIESQKVDLEDEQPAERRKPTSYGRGQRRNQVTDIEEQAQEEQPQPPTILQKEEPVVNQEPERRSRRAYGRGKRPPSSEQNPSLSIEERDELLEKIEQMCETLNYNEMLINKQNAYLAKMKERQLRKKRKQIQKEVGLDPILKNNENIDKLGLSNKFQGQGIENVLQFMQQQENKQKSYLEQQKEEKRKQKEKELKQKMVYPSIESLMHTSVSEFMDKIKQSKEIKKL